MNCNHWTILTTVPILVVCVSCFSPEGLTQRSFETDSIDTDDSLTGCVVYVDQSAAGKQTGHTWGDALGSLQDGIDLAGQRVDGDENIEECEVWVASGTYFLINEAWSEEVDRTETFLLQENVAIFGGFHGNETERAQRDRVANETVLSGVLTEELNAYHVVTGANNSVIDGFTIGGGNANGSGTDARGGGLTINGSSTSVVNCLFRGNLAEFGAAIAVGGESANPNIENCRFDQNGASNSGGAIYTDSNAQLSIANSIFYKNAAQNGGAILASSATITIANSIFWDNNATDAGGAIKNDSSSIQITNSILRKNTSSGTALDQVSGSAGITYCNIEGQHSGAGNFDADPLFVNTDPEHQTLGIDFHPTRCSPGIDKGSNSAPGILKKDCEGNERIEDGDGDEKSTVDIGPYEIGAVLPSSDLPDMEFVDADSDGVDGEADYAIFISTTGDDSSKDCAIDNPCQSVKRGLEVAASCALFEQILIQEGDYDEGVVVFTNAHSGIGLYGGYDQDDGTWTRRDYNDSNETRITNNTKQSEDGQFMTIKSRGAKVSFQNLELVGPSPDDPTDPGADGPSSYVVHADDDSELDFSYVTITQGNGANGVKGDDGKEPAAAEDGSKGANSAGNSCKYSNGGDGGGSCPGGESNAGGLGGDGGASCQFLNPVEWVHGQRGTDGENNALTGGIGGDYGDWDNGKGHGHGYDGQTGVSAAAAEGGHGGENGWISDNTNYWMGGAGEDGLAGKNGGGGGGGGGGSGYNFLLKWAQGSAGGGGGGGGCGSAVPGGGGGAGGAVFGIFVSSGTLDIFQCTFNIGKAGNGGDGGAGADGTVGGSGGSYGDKDPDGYHGGRGGNGGAGGASGGGGGGAGGDHCCVAALEASVTISRQESNVFHSETAMPGAGGYGGAASENGNPGYNGSLGENVENICYY